MARLVTVLFFALLIAASPALAVNLLVNPGFENPATTPPPPEYYGAGAGWTSFGGGIYTIDSSVGRTRATSC